MLVGMAMSCSPPIWIDANNPTHLMSKSLGLTIALLTSGLFFLLGNNHPLTIYSSIIYIYIQSVYIYIYIYICIHRALRILQRLPGGRSRFADESGAQLNGVFFFCPLGPRG